MQPQTVTSPEKCRVKANTHHTQKGQEKAMKRAQETRTRRAARIAHRLERFYLTYESWWDTFTDGDTFKSAFYGVEKSPELITEDLLEWMSASEPYGARWCWARGLIKEIDALTGTETDLSGVDF